MSWRLPFLCPQCQKSMTLRIFLAREDAPFIDCSWCGSREVLEEGYEVERESEFGFREPIPFSEGEYGHRVRTGKWEKGEAGATITNQHGAEFFVPWWNIVFVYTGSGS